MAEEEVGGFFVSLKMLTDEGSFRRGADGIKNLTGGLEGLIKKGLAIAGVTLGIKNLIDTAAAQGQMLITAQQANMSADALANWEGVLNHVGGSMGAFTSAASTMNEEFEKMQFGGKAPSDDFFKAIAQLGLSPDRLKGENQDQRMKEIMNAALGYKGPGGKDYARILVRQLGGGMPGLESIFDYLQLPAKDRNGATFASLQAQSGRENFMTDKDRGGADRGSAALRDLTTSLESIKAKFSSDIMGALAPDIEKLNSWLDSHKDDINNLLDGITNLITAVLSLTGSLLGKAMDPRYQDPTLAGHPLLQKTDALGGQAFIAMNAGIIKFFQGQKKADEYMKWANAQVDKNRKDLELNLHITDATKGGVKIESHPDQSGLYWTESTNRMTQLQ